MISTFCVFVYIHADHLNYSQDTTKSTLKRKSDMIDLTNEHPSKRTFHAKSNVRWLKREICDVKVEINDIKGTIWDLSKRLRADVEVLDELLRDIQ